jgi:hypothetical protein
MRAKAATSPIVVKRNFFIQFLQMATVLITVLKITACYGPAQVVGLDHPAGQKNSKSLQPLMQTAMAVFLPKLNSAHGP